MGVALVENLQRSDLNLLEEAEGCMPREESSRHSPLALSVNWNASVAILSGSGLHDTIEASELSVRPSGEEVH